MATLIEIDTKAKTYSAARADLSEALTAYQDAVEAIRRQHMPKIKRRVVTAKDAQSALHADIAASPDLFVKPKSLTLHGVKVGFKKGSGKLEFEDAEKVIRLIRKHFPKQAELLINTKETPSKAALGEMSADDLKKLGITVEATGDVVLVKDTASDIDKLVSALLKEDDEECEVAG